jgi:hypothetical protein
MTQGEVALAKAFDNAPTAYNPDQMDGDHDGVGDVIDDAVLSANDGTVARNTDSALSALLTNGAGEPISAQTVRFAFDVDGDGTDEQFDGTTGGDGVATITVHTTRPIGSASFNASWDGVFASATATGTVTIVDAANLELGDVFVSRNQVAVAIATLTDSDGAPLAGRSITFYVENKVKSELVWVPIGTAVTDATGTANQSVPTKYLSKRARPIAAGFAGDGGYSSAFATAIAQRS